MSDLSPAAQAVYDAFYSAPRAMSNDAALAAGLRSVAGQIHYKWTAIECSDFLLFLASDLDGATTEQDALLNFSHHSKLEKALAKAIQTKDLDDPRIESAIEALAEWFEYLLEHMGIQPATIPTLLRWQYESKKYIDDNTN